MVNPCFSAKAIRWLRNKEWPFWLETYLLLQATPILLFPTFSPTLALVSIALVIVGWLIARRFSTLPILPFSPLTIPISLVVAATIISYFFSAYPALALSKASNVILGFLFWRYIVTNFAGQIGMQFALALYCTVSLLFITVGTLSVEWQAKLQGFQIVGSVLTRGVLALPETADGRIGANQLAGTILLFWPGCLLPFVSMRYRQKFPYQGKVLAVFTIILTVLLILTQSRTGWLAALITGPIMYAFFARKGNNSRFLRWVIGFGILITAFSLGLVVRLDPAQIDMFLLGNADPLAEEFNSTLEFRLILWQQAITVIADYPFTGVGIGSFRMVVQDLYLLPFPATYDVAHAHNFFLQTALDIGLPGLVAYGALLLQAIAVTFRKFEVASNQQFVAGAALGVLLCFHLFGLADALALGAKPSLLLWCLFAVITLLSVDLPQISRSKL